MRNGCKIFVSQIPLFLTHFISLCFDPFNRFLCSSTSSILVPLSGLLSLLFMLIGAAPVMPIPREARKMSITIPAIFNILLKRSITTVVRQMQQDIPTAYPVYDFILKPVNWPLRRVLTYCDMEGILIRTFRNGFHRKMCRKRFKMSYSL